MRYLSSFLRRFHNWSPCCWLGVRIDAETLSPKALINFTTLSFYAFWQKKIIQLNNITWNRTFTGDSALEYQGVTCRGHGFQQSMHMTLVPMLTATIAANHTLNLQVELSPVHGISVGELLAREVTSWVTATWGLVANSTPRRVFPLAFRQAPIVWELCGKPCARCGAQISQARGQYAIIPVVLMLHLLLWLLSQFASQCNGTAMLFP